ncbi:hypothetical protein [Gymnodinialimonas hymeniacidonis]|uniref:hypothetical protein n=1 Tax=Gymnodinialimonas hymeniacidonis TaxID=3126508 RepID=UPI0034C61AFF
MFKRILILAFSIALLANTASAQGAADRLQTILGRVPVAALEAGEGAIVAGFGNGDAVRWIAVRGAQAGRNPNTPNRFAALRSAAPNQQAIIAANADAALRAAVGLQASDWVNTWEVAQGAARVGALDIFPDSEMRLRGALYVRGLTEEDRGGTPFMWSGGDDFQPSEDLIDPANPFGGDMGLPLRIAFLGDRAVWATGWSALDLALSPNGETLASRADAQAVISGLRRVGNLGALVSVRCWLRNDATLPVTGAEAGPLEGLALADYANRETEGAAMVLLVEEGRDTEALATSLREAWPILSELPSPAEPEISSGGQTITITMRSDWGENGAEINDPYAVFLSVLEGGRLGFLLSR